MCDSPTKRASSFLPRRHGTIEDKDRRFLSNNETIITVRFFFLIICDLYGRALYLVFIFIRFPLLSIQNWSQPCDTHYRNADALNNWNNIMEVLFGVIDRGQLVKTAVFKGDHTSYMNWLSEGHYINSSWPDLNGQHPHIYG